MFSPDEQIDATILSTLDEIGRDLVFAIQLEISDLYPPASAPGTAPHLRSGELQRRIHYTVDQFHDGYTLTVISEMPYSAFLRDGTVKMAARDFMGQEVVDRLTPYVVQRLQAAFPMGDFGGAGPPVNSAYGLTYPSASAVSAALSGATDLAA